MLELTLISAAFAMGAAIPLEYTCAGGRSPPLAWGKAPAGTQSLALLCDDPDAPAGDWVHWVLFNLPPDLEQLDAAVPRLARLPNGAVQGINDYNRPGYEGPCPPPGRPHRYFFKVFALDCKLSLGPTARKPDLLKAIGGHVLAQGQLYGTFRR